MMGWLGDEAAASLMMVLGRVSKCPQHGECSMSLCFTHHTSCLFPATRAAGLIFGAEAIAEYNLRDGDDDDDAAVAVVLARFCAMLLLPKEPPTEPTNARMCSKSGKRNEKHEARLLEYEGSD